MAITWEIKKVAVSLLKENPKNPRALTEKGLNDLEKSIKRFGIAEPLVVNTDYMICGGHGRKKILERLGITEVDCYFPNKKLTTKQFEELNIRLNKNIAGEFDFDILVNEFELEDLIEFGFDKLELGLVDSVDFPELNDGDKESFQQMTFTLSDDQAETVKKAIDKAKKENSFEGTGNENSNGNALYFIAVDYL